MYKAEIVQKPYSGILYIYTFVYLLVGVIIGPTYLLQVVEAFPTQKRYYKLLYHHFGKEMHGDAMYMHKHFLCVDTQFLQAVGIY